LPEGVLAIARFGFFGVIAALDASEPDFLSLTVSDFLSALLVSLPFDSSSPAAPSLSAPLASAMPEDPEGWADSVVPDGDGDDGDCGSEPGEDGGDPAGDPEEEDAEEGESVVEPDEPASDGPAHATPGVVATATPTPKATAKPPTRPTYLA